ncbi:uncharacterized protein MYCFIDRAFT_26183 [Pseudocercospora fijiensis CIRAD86]|uniref:Prolyl 4-hydroxylase alpha subunit domain-containing protein n=1 Tax=Pseudocercospora fijiensis (strain CIRAD86) TaxID=383855 RepID=N1Q7M1_PSEFD|nr:uncharacterized protein MYCFIDRAFT_26183 [Pseudocercospora fijiensis CIRAD86]EME87641.1 hypothetical protein MYCFIDRAFT_26183 [Pseudocercospora fijiensis CIRAD86]
MAGGDSFRYRTILEVAAIAAVIYFFLATPNLSTPGSNAENVASPAVPKARAKVENLVYPSKTLKCERHDYSTHIFSTSPLVIYVEGFLSGEEAEHLVALSEDRWNVSTVVNQGVEGIDDKVRKSEKASIPRDHVVQCIEQRALSFQGWPKDTFIERLWTQRYNVSGHYSLHYDWASSTKTSRRVSSFMVYAKDECRGGGTNFPRLERPKDERWCENGFVECGVESGEGVTFKAKKGAAVFWMNFDAEGRGYKETIHAGMPVLEGQKIGLNIWSWYQAGHQPPEEEVA